MTTLPCPCGATARIYCFYFHDAETWSAEYSCERCYRHTEMQFGDTNERAAAKAAEEWRKIMFKCEKCEAKKEAKFKPGEEVVDMLDKCRLVAESADLGYDVELNVGRWIKYDLENGIPSLAIMRRAPEKPTRWFLGTNKSLETVAGECPCGVIIRNSLDDLRGYNLQAVHELVPLDLMEAIYDYFAITQIRDVKQAEIAQQLAERKGGS